MPTLSRSVCVANVQKTAGTLAISSDGLTVTLSGATFETRWGKGDKIVCGGDTVYVLSKTSSTVMTVQVAFSVGNRNTSGNSYTLNRAYSGATAIATAYAACPSDLQAITSIYEMVLYKDGGNFLEQINFNTAITTGYGVDTGYYIKLTAATKDRHTGIRGTGVRIRPAPGSLSGTCHYFNNPTRIEWIEWDGADVSTVWSGTFDGTAIALNSSAADYGPAYFRNNIVYDWSRTSTGGSAYGVIVLAMGALYRGNYAYNNRFFGNGKSGYATAVLHLAVSGTHAYTGNSLLHNSSLTGTNHKGITYSTIISEVIIAYNNAVLDFSTCLSLYTGSTEDYNLVSDTSTTGAHSLNSKTSANQFVNVTSGTEDLNLKAGADAIGVGSNMGTTYENLNIDILNNTRGSTWDIGASQKTKIVKVHVLDGQQSIGGSFSATTASFAPAANKLYIISVWTTTSYGSTGDPVLTSSTGLAPVLVDKINGTNTFDLRLWTYRAMKPSGLSSGTLTFTWSGVPVDRIRWSIEEFDGVDTSGSDGSGAIVQFAHNTGAVSAGNEFLPVTLSDFSNSNNFGYMSEGAYGYDQQTVTATGFCPMANLITEGSTANSFSTWIRDGNPSVSANIIHQINSNSAVALAIALEVKAQTTTAISKVNGVSFSAITKINGVNKSAINKLNGVQA